MTLRRPSGSIRRFYWRHICRYRYETCCACERPVAKSCPSWWVAPDDLWLAVEGDPNGVRCLPCFTEDARRAGFSVWWQPVVDVLLCTGCHRVSESCWCVGETRLPEEAVKS